MLDVEVAGIIPARAGFTMSNRRRRRCRRDHPRSRGVYPSHGRMTLTLPGSSPLARGLLFLVRAYILFLRIIPARAGFTVSIRRLAGVIRDHPRSRGVYAPPPSGWRGPGGSSPLARGLRGAPVRWGRPPGIIPARAGFTPTHPGHHTPRADHPRSRGVYTRACPMCTGRRGSSPLARGLRVMALAAVALAGIIPARAGFTDRQRSRS